MRNRFFPYGPTAPSRVVDLPSPLTAFCLLLTAYCLLFFPSCKTSIVPPDKWPPSVDTTSHNFVWQVDTIGNQGVFYDVAIIDENNIWAVGEIYLRDSTGQIDPLLYNVAQWNGIKWNIRRVTINFRGNLITPILEGVFAFSATQIWLAGGLAIYGDGSNWTPHDVRLITGFDTLHLSKCWGANPSQMYFVGLAGSLAHYNGGSWQKLESGTSLDIVDVWGSSISGSPEVMAVASRVLSSLERRILRVETNQVATLSDSGINEPVSGVWFIPGKKYSVVGSGYYRKKSLQEQKWDGYPLELTQYYTYAIRGNDTNDVFLGGAFGDVLHYNGLSWRVYPELFMGSGSFYSLCFKGNVVILVGHLNNKAVAAIGKRL